MIKKTTILSILFFCFISISFAQKNTDTQPEVIINKEVSESSMTLSFDNQREINEDRLPSFKSRLINYYSELDEIEYDSDQNRFTLFLNITKISKQELDGILTHFNVYNYSIESK